MPHRDSDAARAFSDRARTSCPCTGCNGSGRVLSQHLDARYALRVAERNPARTGYVLKDRVTDSRILVDRSSGSLPGAA